MAVKFLRQLKTILICGAYCTTHSFAIAKVGEPFIYLDGGWGFGKNHLGKISLDVVYKKHYFSAAFYVYSKPSPNTPADYRSGGWFGPEEHTVYNPIILSGLMYGRTITLRYPYPYVRFILKGGVFAGKFAHAENFIPRKSSGWFFSSEGRYDYDMVSDKAAGLILNPVLELPTRYAGISVGPYAVVSNRISGAGFNMNILFGVLRERLHHNKNDDE